MGVIIVNDNFAVNSTIDKPVIKPLIMFKVLVKLLFTMALVLLLSELAQWFETTAWTTATIDLLGFQITYETCVMYWLGSVIGFSAWHISSDIRQLVNPLYRRSEDILDKIIFTIAVVISNISILLFTVPITKSAWVSFKGEEFSWIGYIVAIAFVFGVVYVLAKAGTSLMNYVQTNSDSNGVAFLLSNLMCLGALGFGLLCTVIVIVIFVLFFLRFAFWIAMNNR